MLGLKEKPVSIVNRDRTESLRVRADQSESFCFVVSMAEVAASMLNKPVMKRAEALQLATEIAEETEDEPGKVSLSKAIYTTVKTANRLGLEITQVMIDTFFLDKLNIPKGIAIHEVTEANEEIKKPAIRIMVIIIEETVEGEGRGLKFHAESDINDLTDRRIEEKGSRGWQNVVAIGFRKKE